MNYSELIRRDIEVGPLHAEIDQRTAAWFEQMGRQAIRVRAAALAISIRVLRNAEPAGGNRVQANWSSSGHFASAGHDLDAGRMQKADSAEEEGSSS